VVVFFSALLWTTAKGPFIATQLNSTQLNWTQLDVELSTRSQREQQLTQFVGRDVINKNTTDLAVRCSTGSVEFCRYKHYFKAYQWTGTDAAAMINKYRNDDRLSADLGAVKFSFICGPIMLRFHRQRRDKYQFSFLFYFRKMSLQPRPLWNSYCGPPRSGERLLWQMSAVSHR